MSATAITGIRELAEESYPDVELAVADECGPGASLVFGGALGADTVALRAACAVGGCNRLVVVPWTVDQQPIEARRAIEECATEISELRLPRSKESFLRRNDAMLALASRVLAFTDGRSQGGTAYTVRAAKRLGIPTTTVLVKSSGKLKNPVVKHPDFLEPVYAFARYVPMAKGGSRLTRLIYKMKGGTASVNELDALADDVAAFMGQNDLWGLPIVPMPRRIPGYVSDLYPLALRLGERLGSRVMPDWLIRTSEPQAGAFTFGGRTHYPAAEHEKTLDVMGYGKPIGDTVVLLDNVVTFSGTLVGAQQAIRNATAGRIKAIGVVLSCAGDLECVGPTEAGALRWEGT